MPTKLESPADLQHRRMAHPVPSSRLMFRFKEDKLFVTDGGFVEMKCARCHCYFHHDEECRGTACYAEHVAYSLSKQVMMLLEMFQWNNKQRVLVDGIFQSLGDEGYARYQEPVDDAGDHEAYWARLAPLFEQKRQQITADIQRFLDQTIQKACGVTVAEIHEFHWPSGDAIPPNIAIMTMRQILEFYVNEDGELDFGPFHCFQTLAWNITVNSHKRTHWDARPAAQLLPPEPPRTGARAATMADLDILRRELFEETRQHRVALLEESKQTRELVLEESKKLRKRLLSETLQQLGELQGRGDSVARLLSHAPDPHLIDMCSCPISLRIMKDPVITPSGVTFERTMIEQHLERVGAFDPTTHEPLKKEDLYPNRAVRNLIEKHFPDHAH